MTPSEYSKRYGMNSGSLSKYLNQGRVRGAKKVNDAWIIPEDALVEYCVRKKKDRTVQDVVWDILNALNRGCYFDAEVLKVQEGVFQNATRIALRQGYMSQSDRKTDGVTTSGFDITELGIESLAKKKSEFVRTLADAMGALAGSYTASMINNLPS